MPSPRGVAVALAGAVGSGKSTLGRMLAERMNGEVASFGDFVRHIATQRGITHDRHSLQALGQSRIDENPAAFVAEFLVWAAPKPGKLLVIDGVRHAAVDDILREWSREVGRSYYLILIDASLAERAKRRHSGNEVEARRVDEHRVERETVCTLPSVADLVVDGDGEPENVLKRILAEAPAVIVGRIR